MTTSGGEYGHELARAFRQPHEAWLVTGTLGPAWGEVYRAVACGFADERASNPPRRRSGEYAIAVKALNYFALSARGVLGLLCAALFVVVAFALASVLGGDFEVRRSLLTRRPSLSARSGTGPRFSVIRHLTEGGAQTL
ncbi:hypothetical protein [uncultured Cellulomonas sp.]|uniref:hypothetical protein n=1 Tax=uncultured Cellulomonas sp. TaxID=189682 RepID=UPI0028E519CD|nr:hypothetical protein [uncultured Cellulomonas sp.]